MAFGDTNGFSNFTRLATTKGLWVGVEGQDFDTYTQVVNSSGAYVGPITTSPSFTASSTTRIGFDVDMVVTGNTVQSASYTGERIRLNRTITSSVTDTGAGGNLSLPTTFNVSAAQTLTNTNASGHTALRVPQPTVTGGGSINFTSYRGIVVDNSSLNTGTYKAGLCVGAQTGATNNVVLFLGANGPASVLMTGQYEIFSVGTGLSRFAGAFEIANQADPGAVTDGIRIGSVDISAGNASLSLRTETAVITESVTSDRTLPVQINGTTYKICLKV